MSNLQVLFTQFSSLEKSLLSREGCSIFTRSSKLSIIKWILGSVILLLLFHPLKGRVSAQRQIDSTRLTGFRVQYLISSSLMEPDRIWAWRACLDPEPYALWTPLSDLTEFAFSRTKKPGTIKDVIFLDITAAIDRIWRKNLMGDLVCHQILNQDIIWVRNFLSSRRRTLVGHRAPYAMDIRTGVREDSVLGLLALAADTAYIASVWTHK